MFLNSDTLDNLIRKSRRKFVLVLKYMHLQWEELIRSCAFLALQLQVKKFREHYFPDGNIAILRHYYNIGVNEQFIL